MAKPNRLENTFQTSCSSSVVEHLIGNEEAESSILSCSTISHLPPQILVNILNGLDILGVLQPSFRQYVRRSVNANLTSVFWCIKLPEAHSFQGF